MSDTTQVNGYELHEKLGSGGFGAVYRAYQPTVGREVAIKIILPHHASRPEFVRRFEVEAQVIARLEHMNIVPLYDYWRDPDGAYLVMRYMRGGSLRQMIKQAPFDPATAAVLLEQVAGALAIAHRHGVIHRDLKPENVLLDEDGNAYLGDFGIAKNLAILDGGTDTGDVIGSPGYLAPEQARGETVAPQTDVYSLGVMLYEILCGEHPFPNTNPVEKIYKHLNEPLPLLNNLAPDVEAAINDVIQKATAKNPRHRFENAIAFAEAFRQAAAIERDSSDIVIEMLTPREQQVLHYIIAGKSNRQIAETLVVEVSTVKWYIKQIYRKLNVHNRVQAIVRGRELDLVVGDEEKGDHTYLSTYYELPDVKNPYKGLRAFETVDSDDFFGRDKLIKKLVTRLDLNNGTKGGRFLAVVGPSGSGKSSVVKAGLIPALWRGDLPGSENWYVAEVLPGPRPLDELEIALTRLAPNNSINLREHLERDEYGLLRAAQLILPDDGSELLLVIDQFEEVFTLVEDETRRQHFLDLIQAAVTDQRSRVRVVVTLRADFYDRPLQYPRLGDLMREHMETVLPLSAEELQQVILKPADKLGIRFEEGLVARIIGDVNYQPGSLPLLQYALTELFDRRDGRTITQEAYTKIGGTVGALAKRADELFAEFDEDGQEAIRQMFMRLITLGEGTEDTRRRVQRSELLSVGDDSDLMDDVIDSFAGYRLLALDNDPTTREPTVEVAHEAILREWERLRGWLNDSRDDIKTQRQVSTLSAEWEAHERSMDYLVRGARLDQLQLWSTDTSLTLTPAEQAFLDASIAERKRREAKEQAQVEREASLQQRARRILQGLVAVFLIAAVVSGVIAIWALDQQSRAEKAEADAVDQRDNARRDASRAEAAEAFDLMDDGFEDEAVEKALSAIDNADTPESLGALANIVEAYNPYETLPDIWANGQRNFMILATDGSQVLHIRSGPLRFQLWDLSTYTAIDLTYVLDGIDIGDCDHVVCRLDWDSTHDTAVIWQDSRGDIFTPEEPLVIDTRVGEIKFRLQEDDTRITALDLSSDFTKILTGDDGGTITYRSTQDGSVQQLITTEHEGFYQVAWSPDDEHFAALATDGRITIWNASTKEQIAVVPGNMGSTQSIDWSPDGSMVASAGEDGVVRLWDAMTGELVKFLIGSDNMLDHLKWSPDGQLIASHSPSGKVYIWDVATANLGTQLLADIFTNIIWSADSARIIVPGSGRNDGLRLYSIETLQRSIPLVSSGDTLLVWRTRWDPIEKYILTTSFDGTVRFWDAETLEEVVIFENTAFEGEDTTWTPGAVRDPAWSPLDPSVITFSGGDNILRIWDISTQEISLEKAITDDGIALGDPVWSPNGEYLKISVPANNNQILIVDSETGDVLTVIENSSDESCFFIATAWSPDSQYLAGSCFEGTNATERPTFVWDVTSGKLLHTLRAQSVPWWTQWMPGGERIVIGYVDGTARFWNPNTGELVTSLEISSEPVNVSISQDGSFIAFGSWDGRITIWNTKNQQIQYSFTTPGQFIQDMNWSTDGEHLLIGGTFDPAIKRVWRSSDELIEHAYDCCVRDRALDNEERARYGLPPRDD